MRGRAPWYKLLVQWLPEHESVLFSILPSVTAAVGFSIFWLVLAAHVEVSLTVPSTAHRAFSFVVGFLIVMRTSTSYARYTEGYSQLGQIGKVVRSATREVALLAAREDNQVVGRFARYAKLFLTLAMAHLRGASDLTAEGSIVHLYTTPEELEYLAGRSRRPLLIIGWLSIEIAVLRSRNLVSELEYLHLQDYMAQLTDVFLGCTKVKAMPLPFCYSQIFACTITMYIYSIPIAFADEYGNATPIVTFFAAFVMYGLWAVSSQMEDVFGDFLLNETVPMTRIMRSTFADIDAIAAQIADMAYGATHHSSGAFTVPGMSLLVGNGLVTKSTSQRRPPPSSYDSDDSGTMESVHAATLASQRAAQELCGMPLGGEGGDGIPDLPPIHLPPGPFPMEPSGA